MKVKWSSDRFDVEAEGVEFKDCFEELAGAIEVLTNNKCGACDSGEAVPVVRENQGNKFFEMLCRSCGCTLGFGQRRSDGKLFPKRIDKNNKRLPDGGWTKWQPREDAPAKQTEVPF